MSRFKLAIASVATVLFLASGALALGPVVISVSPNSATAGAAALTLTVSGSGFSSGSTVLWNGAALTTTFVSSGQLTATVPSTSLAAAGTASVSVITPGHKGGTSNALVFTINAAASSGGTGSGGGTTTTPLTVATTSIPTGTTGTSYSATVSATGGSAPYTWSVSTGTPPPGLTLSSAGALSGVPTTSGSYSFTAQVKDAASHVATYSYAMSVGAGTTTPVTLSISPSTLANGTAGTAYPSTALTASGGTAPYTWTQSSIPPGMALSSVGTLSGTPSTAGSYTLAVTAKDAVGNTGTKSYSVTVAAATTTQTTTSGVVFNDAFQSGSLSNLTGLVGNICLYSSATGACVTGNAGAAGAPAPGPAPVVYPGATNALQIRYVDCGGNGTPSCNGAAADVDDSLYWYYPNGINHFTVEGLVYIQSPQPDGTVGNGRKLFYIWQAPNNPQWSVILSAAYSAGACGTTANQMFLAFTQQVPNGTFQTDCGSGPPYLNAVLNFNTWYDIKLEIKTISPAPSQWSGTCNVWVNGTPALTNASCFDFNVGTTVNPLTAFRIGMQADTGNGSPIDEFRYWSNITITALNP